ncbi:GrpB family protein [Micromonospora phytophila]|uniref:GrpB family protein n=1 Tax=Micromonospora phytophila TaxID=709888 RepID=UPI0020305CDE|nr:GrpB family protein [Micromonospora phytophila]MCM0674979.1 GrpB family protein [Micromonospora phytophila]
MDRDCLSGQLWCNIGGLLDAGCSANDQETETELIGGIEHAEIRIVDYDPRWPDAFATHADRIRRALGPAARAVEHIGSTSVPGLAAKPIIDILVTVDDVEREDEYVTALDAAGYELRVREPGHRMMRTPTRHVHIHILQPEDPACDDYRLLREWLRRDSADRALYAATKRDLARRDWTDTNAYADAKTDVITQINNRARSARI